MDAQILTAAKRVKKLPVDFSIYAHYSGHASFTKGLLLVDTSGTHIPKQTLEITADTCQWRSKGPGTSWKAVDAPQLLSRPDRHGDKMTAFKVVRAATGHLYVELSLKQMDGNFKSICKLWVLCKPGHFLNTKMAMLKEDVRFVHGQLGPHTSAVDGDFQHVSDVSLLQSMQESEMETMETMDQEFLIQESWTALGGSEAAAIYLNHADEGGLSLFQRKSCSPEEAAEAKAICKKHLGDPSSQTNFRGSFASCVFDVCQGGGEAAAELAAEVLKVQ